MKEPTIAQLADSVLGFDLGGDSINKALCEATQIADTVATSLDLTRGFAESFGFAQNMALNSVVAELPVGLGKALCPSAG